LFGLGKVLVNIYIVSPYLVHEAKIVQFRKNRAMVVRKIFLYIES